MVGTNPSGERGGLRFAYKMERLKMTPKYPHVKVQLTGKDGSAASIVSTCRREARAAGVPSDELDEFMRIAYSGDYDNVIATAMNWFDCW